MQQDVLETFGHQGPDRFIGDNGTSNLPTRACDSDEDPATAGRRVRKEINATRWIGLGHGPRLTHGPKMYRNRTSGKFSPTASR